MASQALVTRVLLAGDMRRLRWTFKTRQECGMNSTTQPAMKPARGTDKAHDVLRTEGHPLDALFRPKTVAVIGATERAQSIGRRVMWALVTSPFGGTVFPVSKDRASVLGIK